MTDESIATIAETITEAIEARESAHREVAAVATTLDMIYRLRYDATEAAKRADVAPVKGLWFLSPVTTRDNTIRHVRKSMNNIVGIGHWCEFVDADGPGIWSRTTASPSPDLWRQRIGRSARRLSFSSRWRWSKIRSPTSGKRSDGPQLRRDVHAAGAEDVLQAHGRRHCGP